MLGLSAGFLGLVLGTAVGGWVFVPEGSGLAGPAIALSYGLFTALAAVALSYIFTKRASLSTVRRASIGASALALVVVLVLTLRVMSADAPEERSSHQETVPVRR